MTAQRIAVVTLNFVPEDNHTFKYDWLGELALLNRRQYCAAQGYTLIEAAPAVPGRPACWAKLPAILAAFDDHEWVLWADSDALLLEPSQRLERFCASGHDMVVQSHDAFFRYVGMDVEQGRKRMPINTGVFLMRRSAWAERFVEAAFEQTELVTTGAIWDGIGEQEAMVRVLRADPSHLDHITWVEGLQNHPKLHRRGDLFVHLYGNYARHRISPRECAQEFERWSQAIQRGGPFPHNLARLHWCCIQNKDPAFEIQRGDLDHFLYTEQDILP